MEGLSSSSDVLTLSLSSGKVSQQDITNLEQIYCLLVGSDVQSNDSICFVFKFRNELWIIPESRYYQSLKDVLAKDEFKAKVLVAQIDYLPFSWRKNKFLLGMEGDLAIKDISIFSEIEGEISILSNFRVGEI
jgi:hypothetical protein